MKTLILLLLFLVVSCSKAKETKPVDFSTIFETSNGSKTATYDETIAFYEALANAYPSIHIQSVGLTDAGKPLHLVTWNPDGNFDFETIREQKQILLINNGIHPGEPDGIDATMLLLRDLAQSKINTPKHSVVCTIPIYNIGGSLNRNSTSRTNQNGPEAYGFRGNAQNYDLNRDFIKSDTQNALAFAEIFHMVKPAMFIDNHVSNGADYQYTLTHLFTQHNKLGGDLGNYLHHNLMPNLEQKLAQKNWDITPYVNVFNRVPEGGFSQFMDSPRYSTGYTTLWNTLGMMVETHMLKPYKPRVEGTYELMLSMLELLETEATTISELRTKAFSAFKTGMTYPLDWELDTTKTSTLQFKGYEGEMISSDLTGQTRLQYNRDKPFTKPVTYSNYFKPKIEVTIPKAYVIPQGWRQVIALLKHNHIEMQVLERDTTLTVESYRIASYDTRKQAYEGHYPHYNTALETKTSNRHFRKGDVMLFTQQAGLRYLLETLEPQAPDSFFNWNFFDTILQQKEGFSPYVWEDKALEVLEANPSLKTSFEEKKQQETDFANNWYAQLDWIHKHSDYYEKAHMEYPVYRLHN